MSTTAAPRVTLQEFLPRLVLAPSFALILLFVYGFIIFTGVLSFSGSKLMPDLTTWVGFDNYVRLFKHPNWLTSLRTWDLRQPLHRRVQRARPQPGDPVDQKIRSEGMLRYLSLPMALSFIVSASLEYC